MVTTDLPPTPKCPPNEEVRFFMMSMVNSCDINYTLCLTGPTMIRQQDKAESNIYVERSNSSQRTGVNYTTQHLDAVMPRA